MLSSKYLDEYFNNNKSGKMSSEKFVIKNYPNDYEKIINYTLNLDLTFKQRVYHIVHNIPNLVLCKNPKCKNKVNFKNSTIGYYEYCSNKCIGTDPNIIEKKSKKSIQKFGTKTPAESNKVKDKIIETNKKRYGGNSPMSSLNVQKKSKNTLIKNFKVDNPSKSPQILKKRVDTFKKNIQNWKKKYKETSKEKYGFEHPWMCEKIHNKSVISSKQKKIETAIEKAKSKIGDSYLILDATSSGVGRVNYDIICPKCESTFIINSSNLYSRNMNNTEICTLCNPIGKGTSGLEFQLLDYIKSVYTKEIQSNVRGIISPYELDIYLPEDKIAFEFNGLFWHSEQNKPKDYHYRKTKMCEELGISLIHIWEDDWIFKNEIIKSIINNKLGLNVEKVYARNCVIKEITSKESKIFVEENHIQGNSNGLIKLGLFYKDELVSLMTFSKKRISLNQKHKEGNYELIRYVNKINLSVIGSASKLFKYFINKFDPKEVISYSDSSIFDGEVYKNLGFKFIGDTDIGYHWVINKERKHRYNFRKSNLVKMGYDKSKTEVEIMYEDFGSYRIWGCGMKKWIFVK